MVMNHHAKSMGYKPFKASKIKTADINNQMILANTLVKERGVEAPPAIDAPNNRIPKITVGIHAPKIPQAMNGIPNKVIHTNRIKGGTCLEWVSWSKNNSRNSLPKLLSPLPDCLWE